MPLLFAFVASLGLHAAALLGPGWGLPLSQEPEPPTTIDAERYSRLFPENLPKSIGCQRLSQQVLPRLIYPSLMNP